MFNIDDQDITYVLIIQMGKIDRTTAIGFSGMTDEH